MSITSCSLECRVLAQVASSRFLRHESNSRTTIAGFVVGRVDLGQAYLKGLSIIQTNALQALNYSPNTDDK
jgi:hypothetical protein